MGLKINQGLNFQNKIESFNYNIEHIEKYNLNNDIKYFRKKVIPVYIEIFLKYHLKYYDMKISLWESLKKKKQKTYLFKVYINKNEIHIHIYHLKLKNKKKYLSKMQFYKSFNQIINSIEKSEKRKNIPFKKRIKVYNRDNFTCQYCGWKNGTNKGDRILHIDHIIPIFYGGTNNINNLVTSCYKCNLHKNCKIYFNSSKDFTICYKM